MTWERPLDGVGEVPWEALLGDAAPALIAALTRLAESTGPGASAADPVMDVISDEVDYGYMEYAIDFGYWPAGVPVIRFLARIAAAHPSDSATVAAIELIELIVNAPMDRPGAPNAELDAWVDGLRTGLWDAEAALAEAARLVPAVGPAVTALAERGTGALGYSGSYEPRWRGVAREFARLPGWSIRAVADRLIVGERHLLDPESGDLVEVSGPPWPTDRVSFIDAEGPGLLTAEGRPRDGGRRGPLRLWRPGAPGFRVGSPLRPWPLLPGVLSLAADQISFYVGHSNGIVTRHDSRTGDRIGPKLRVPAPRWRQSLHAYEDDSRKLLMAVSRESMYSLDFARGRATEMPMTPFAHAFAPFRLHGRLCFAVIGGTYPPGPLLRLDAATGEPVGPPIPLFEPTALCAYELDGRPMLAAGSRRQLHRFDAATGEPAGPPLSGHRRDILGVAAIDVAGRATLFSVDGATVRRWDAASGTPWPA